MYVVDQAAIATRIHASPSWERAAMSAYAMVASTIHTATTAVLTNAEKALREGDSADCWNFPTRRMALDAIRSGTAVPVLRRMHALMQVGEVALAHLTACELPGLAYPKAAFLIQILYGELGCFDSRNERDLGVKVADVVGLYGSKARSGSKARERQYAQVHAYSALCTQHGGSAHLWDAWCAGISAQFPARWATANDISAEHVRWFDCLHAALWRDAGDIAAYVTRYPSALVAPPAKARKAKRDKRAA